LVINSGYTLQWFVHKNGNKNGENISYPITFTKRVVLVGCYRGDSTSGSSGPLAVLPYLNRYSYYGSETFKNEYKNFIASGY